MLVPRIPESARGEIVLDDFKWDERYSIGNERIDCQHHYFVELISWLSHKLQSGQAVV